MDEILEIRDKLQPIALFTFAPGQESKHLASALVRTFKNSRDGRNPAVFNALAVAMAQQAAYLLRERGVTHICRVLGSWETLPDPQAPLDVLTHALAGICNLPILNMMRRTTPRPPMSASGNLAGQEAFIKRVRYAAQDLVFREDISLVGAKVLIVDDIRCLGASEAVWAWAMAKFGGASGAMGLSLAQMEGLDYRSLVLDQSCDLIRDQARDLCLESEKAAFDPVWLEPRSKTLHLRGDCPEYTEAKVNWWRVLAPEGSDICSACKTAGQSTLGRMLGRLFNNS